MQKALAALLAAIDAGEEFPDASARIAMRYRVNVDTLTERYDDWCIRNERN
jgi:hypothetical protein